MKKFLTCLFVNFSPDNRRFHTKNEMRIYLENNPELVAQEYEHALTDFGVHLKLARRLGWISHTPDGTPSASLLPSGTLSSTSPLVKRRKLSLKKKRDRDTKGKQRRPKINIKLKVPKDVRVGSYTSILLDIKKEVVCEVVGFFFSNFRNNALLQAGW